MPADKKSRVGALERIRFIGWNQYMWPVPCVGTSCRRSSSALIAETRRALSRTNGRKRARSRDNRAGERRRPRGEVPIDPSWGIRSRGDASCARGQARCAIDQTGNRNRIVQSTARRRETACPQKRRRFSAHSEAGCTGDGKGESRRQTESLEDALHRSEGGATEGGTLSGIAWGARQTGAFERKEAHSGAEIDCGQESRPNARTPGLIVSAMLGQ